MRIRCTVLLLCCEGVPEHAGDAPVAVAAGPAGPAGGGPLRPWHHGPSHQPQAGLLPAQARLP